MKNLLVVYDGTLYTYKWIKTLFWAKHEFLERGYSIHYTSIKSFFPFKKFAYGQIDPVLDRWQVDVLLIAYHPSTAHFYNKNNLSKIEILQLIRNKCERIVWLDTSDSTGTTQFEVLPYVDVYLKKQLLRDVKLYEKHHYGQRIYLDYYHKKYDLVDPEIDSQYTLLDPQYADKLRVSWNIGLADIWRKGRQVVLHPFTITKPQMVPVDNKRSIDIFFNGTVKYSPLVSFQRKKTCDLIAQDSIRKHSDPLAKMSHEEYIDCMKKSKSALSPFGWGEICYRDFEIIVYGSLLIKPSVEHLITYPNIFIADTTYIPLDWDFANYESVVERINQKGIIDLAENAQQLFARYVSDKGSKAEFVTHFIRSIES